MLKRLETIIPKAETAFKVLYILLVLLSFTNLMVGNPVLRYYTYALVLFGAVLLLYRAVHFKRFVRTKGLWILVLFCGSILFSAFLNRKYGLTESLQSFIWTTLQFGLLYACDEKRDIQEYQREFCILAVVFSVYIRQLHLFRNWHPVRCIYSSICREALRISFVSDRPNRRNNPRHHSCMWCSSIFQALPVSPAECCAESYNTL